MPVPPNDSNPSPIQGGILSPPDPKRSAGPSTGVANEILLSVIIIARNEEEAIARCLESLLAETSGMKAELLLVDSASTDRTREIAAGYGVRIVRILEGGQLSPALGRYVGTLVARGKYLFFVDGDMIIAPHWLHEALQILENPTVAGVGGRLYEVHPDEGLNDAHPDRQPLGQAQLLGGSAVYAAAALRKVGTFSPSLRGEEERELAFRLRTGGFTVLKVAAPMAYHLRKRRTQGELDEKVGYYTGIGQVVRAYFPRRLAWNVLRVNVSVLVFNASLVAALLVLLWSWLSAPPVLAAVLTAVLAAPLIGLLLAKGPRRVYLYFRFKILGMVSILRGLRAGIVDPAVYASRIAVAEPFSTILRTGGLPAASAAVNQPSRSH